MHKIKISWIATMLLSIASAIDVNLFKLSLSLFSISVYCFVETTHKASYLVRSHKAHYEILIVFALLCFALLFVWLEIQRFDVFK